MKRAMSGLGRRGAPPLARRRGALRVVQLTLLAVTIALGLMAVRALGASAEASPPSLSRASAGGLGEAAVLAAGAVLSASAAVAMGLRTVRGPRPPDL